MDLSSAAQGVLQIITNDWAVQQLQNVFSNSNSPLAIGLSAFNYVFMAVGSLLLMWSLGRGMIDTAHHGEVWGKKSEVWVPFRFVMAVGLMLPVGSNGMGSGQMAVLTAAEIGLSAGSHIWSLVVTAVAAPQAFVAPVPPSATQFAGKLFLMEVCMETANKIAASGGGPTVTLKRENSGTVGSGPAPVIIMGADGDRTQGGVGAQCGAITYRNPTIVNPAGTLGGWASAVAKSVTADSSSGTGQILQAQKDATQTLLTALQPIAHQIATAYVPPYDATQVSIDSSSIMPAIQAFDTAVVQAATTASGQLQQQQGAQAAAQQGFAFAGAWAMSLTLTQDRLMSAMNSLPAVASPKFDWYQGIASDQLAMMKSAMNWWSDVTAKQDIDTSGGAMNLAYGGVATDDPLMRVIDPSRWTAIYRWLLTNDLSVNPLGSMIEFGHHILSLFYVALAAWATIGATAKGIEGIPLVGGIVGGALDGGLSNLSVMVWMVLLSLFTVGGFLAYVLPMMPAIYWILSVARYFMRVFMTILAAPAWALAHIELEGESLGHRALPGWQMLIDLVIRPPVMVLSLVLAFVALNLFGALFEATFFPAIANALQSNFGGITGIVFFLVVGTTVMITLCTVSFLMIHRGTEHVMHHFGFSTYGDTSAEHDAQRPIEAAQKAASQIGQIGDVGIVKASIDKRAQRAAAQEKSGGSERAGQSVNASGRNMVGQVTRNDSSDVSEP